MGPADDVPALVCLEHPPHRSGGQYPYTVVVPDTETETKGATRRCGYPHCQHGPSLALHGCYTSYELFRRGASVAPERPALGRREVDSQGNPTPYIFQTYREVEERVDNFASGLQHEGLTPPNPDGMRLLGIYSRNRPEWIIAEQAAFAHSAVTVPFYDTLGPDTIEYIIGQTLLTTVVCSGAPELARLTEVVQAGRCPTLKTAVVMSGVGNERVGAAQAAGLRVYQMLELEGIGAIHQYPHRPPASKDLMTFCYTSGTTGEPKGALLTHANIVSAVASFDVMGMVKPDKEDVYMSYLPLPHIFERVVIVSQLCVGASVGFSRGDPLLLIQDFVALRPTIMPAVPRILNRIHDRLTQGMLAAGGLKTKLFVRACEAKVAGLHKGVTTHALWDKLVFNKLKAAIGMDRMRMMVTGSAPIAAHVLTFMRIMLGCPVMEGYGQTETTAGATITQAGDFSVGHVGGPFPCNEICLMDVPDMGYLHTDTWHGSDSKAGGKGGIACQGRGEICFRGTNVFSGYYKMEEKTQEAMDADGWLHSGDIGLWNMDGALMIIDRKKNIFKLAQGEYVAAEKIENIHTQSSLVAQSFVYGDSLQSSLVAVVVPDQEAVTAWANANGHIGKPMGELCAGEELRKAILEELRMCGDRAQLQGFERVRAVHLEPEPFSAENGVLTPTFKLRRAEAKEKYSSVIDRLYASLKKASTSAQSML